MRRRAFFGAAAAALTSVAWGGGVRAAAPAPVDQARILIMTRSALLALDQANKTGNYTVLRDLGSTTFHANTAARLAEVFADLRAQNLDLSATLAAPITFTPPPAVDGRGLLRVTGAAPLGRRTLAFQIAWAFEGGDWRLYGIVVTSSEPAAAPVRR